MPAGGPVHSAIRMATRPAMVKLLFMGVSFPMPDQIHSTRIQIGMQSVLAAAGIPVTEVIDLVKPFRVPLDTCGPEWQPGADQKNLSLRCETIDEIHGFVIAMMPAFEGSVKARVPGIADSGKGR